MMKKAEIEKLAAEMAGEDLDPKHLTELATMIGAYERSGTAFRMFCKAFELSQRSVCDEEEGLPAAAVRAVRSQVTLLNNTALHSELDELDTELWAALDAE